MSKMKGHSCECTVANGALSGHILSFYESQNVLRGPYYDTQCMILSQI